MSTAIVNQKYQITQQHRQKQLGQNSFVIWFTGLSGSGKSTIANQLEQVLFGKGLKTFTLDGDHIRKGINKDLNFSPEDRTENIRRVAEIAKLMIDAGLIVIAAFISPYQKDRVRIKEIVGADQYIEVFVDASIETCEQRDVKGLYKKARAGQIKNMTGISAPYEKPTQPNITIKTEEKTVEEAVTQILNYIEPKCALKNG